MPAERIPAQRSTRLPGNGPLLALTIAMTATCVGPIPGPVVCGPEQPCGAGEACVVGRCRPPTAPVVSAQSELERLEPEEIALVADGRDAEQVPDVVTLGAGDGADGLLLMRFAIAPLRTGALERAVLELVPARPCAAHPTILELWLRHARSEWRADAVRPSRMPELGLPMRAGRYSTHPARPLRLDVTEIVRAWIDHPRRYHGLALEAERVGPPGAACFGSGAGALAGPSLTLYVTPRPERDAGDAGLEDAGGERDGGGGASSDATENRGDGGGVDAED